MRTYTQETEATRLAAIAEFQPDSTLTFEGVSISCLWTPVTKSKAMSESGYDALADAQGDVSRADAQGIGLLSKFQRSSATQRPTVKRGQLSLSVLAVIDDDSADATIKLLCKALF